MMKFLSSFTPILIFIQLTAICSPQISGSRQYLFLPTVEPRRRSAKNIPDSHPNDLVPDDFNFFHNGWTGYAIKRLAKLADKWNRWGMTNNCSHPVPDFQTKCDVINGGYKNSNSDGDKSTENGSKNWWDDGISEEERDGGRVRVVDIKVVASLGDSISAGFGMLTNRPPNSRILEYRGKVFSIGGDNNEITLPNILKLYSPEVIGASAGCTLPLANGNMLNRAKSGSKIDDIPGQAQSLVTLLSLAPYSQHANNWKLITILIGANNICRACQKDKSANPAAFEKELRDALLILRNGISKAVVQVMGLFDVAQVYDAAQADPYCTHLMSHFPFCPCISHSQTSRSSMTYLAATFNTIIRRVIAEFGVTKSFAVFYQPAVVKTDVKKYGTEFLSGLDCFHPNICSNRVMAAALWNAFWTDESEKENEAKLLDPYSMKWKCPGSKNLYFK